MKGKWDRRFLERFGRGTALVVLGAIVGFAGAAAQSRDTERSPRIHEPATRPAASLDDVAWMIGSWEGDAFGGTCEEDWLPPSAGTMTGVFKLIHDGRPSMYEFMMIVEADDSLVVRLKHFDSDFTSWEDKSEYVSFPLVKLTEDAAYFDGLSYRRVGNDRLLVQVSVGEREEAELLLVRKGADSAPPGPSPYAGMEGRKIKAMSEQEVAAYRAGEGMGFAMAAELNGYPGPKHVLELQRELKLSPDQIEATRRVFERMHAAATALGIRIVAAEQSLDGSFAEHRISQETLQSATEEIADLEGALRAVHLQAHLEMVEILSPGQRHSYMTHRGYGDDSMPARHHPGMHDAHGN